MTTTQLIAHALGEILQLAPTPDPTAPAPYQPIVITDPTVPKPINIGKILGFILVAVAIPLLVWVGIKVIAKGGAQGDLGQSFQMSVGALLGIAILVFAIGGGMGLIFGVFGAVF